MEMGIGATAGFNSWAAFSPPPETNEFAGARLL